MISSPEKTVVVGLNRMSRKNFWNSKEGDKGLPPEATILLDQCLMDVEKALGDGMGIATLINADVEQFREEVRKVVALVQVPKNKVQ